ncbi:TIGR03557 family F420-dependent LLM class oxidoreductase [Streptomyces sp. NPDC006463]|uniref:TIGR03557 family F420-dependent LLM class oxidoreductase n=1 Tax=Streptomyces sp. NPDC006463 TaxID=3364746 RepID=UPI0036D0B1AE
MVRIRYAVLIEQAGPRELVSHMVGAERAGFDFSVISDHSFPRLESQGHAPYAWSVLGAAAQATSRIPLATYVTCPTFRYHPAVGAQKAATMQILSQGRFRLGIGSGENLNEHVVGAGRPAAHVRRQMLEESVEIIRRMFTGAYLSHHGAHFDVENARLWDVPDKPPPSGTAISGPRSCALAGRYADLVVATEPKAELLRRFDALGGAGKPRVGQLHVCYDTDRDAAVERAHDQFRWTPGGWKVNAELPGPAGFEQASQRTRPPDVAEAFPGGDDADAFVEAVRPCAEAGFTVVAPVQIGGGHQEPSLDWAEPKLLPALATL